MWNRRDKEIISSTQAEKLGKFTHLKGCIVTLEVFNPS